VKLFQKLRKSPKLPALGTLARKAVRAAGEIDAPGEARAAEARRLLAQWIDDLLELPPILEALDGVLIHLLIETAYRTIHKRRRR
jgi:hypothetical protein